MEQNCNFTHGNCFLSDSSNYAEITYSMAANKYSTWARTHHGQNVWDWSKNQLLISSCMEPNPWESNSCSSTCEAPSILLNSCSLSYSQELTTGPYTERDEFPPHPVLFLWSILILSGSLLIFVVFLSCFLNQEWQINIWGWYLFIAWRDSMSQ